MLRKLTIVALAVAFFMTGAALYAQQVPHFILSGTTFQVRQHGQTEVVGDITMTCDVAGTFPVPSAMTVIYTPVFGIVNSSSGTFVTASAQSFNARTAYVESESTGTAIVIGTAALNTVTTNSVTIGLSGYAAIGDIIRVMGIRVNIGEANLPVNSQVNGTVIAIPPNAFQLDNVNTFPVAYVLDEIKVTKTAADPILICLPQNCKSASLTVAEKFPSALTTVTDENDIQHKPSSASAKKASYGTQLKVTIANILPGVTVSVPTGTITGTPSSLTIILTSQSSGTGGSYTCSASGGVCSVSFTFSTTGDSIVVTEQVSIPVTFCPTAIPVPPTFGTMTGQVTLGPNAGTGFSGEVTSSKILSFIPNPLNTPADGLESLVACTTNLLCKFLTTATGAVAGGGYDTGLAIANTSKDIWYPSNSGANAYGALPQQGVCRVYLFGSGGTIAANPSTTPTYTTPVLVPGQDSVFSLKFTAGVGAGYQGYGIVQCDFQYAHAEVIVADQNFSTFSHGFDCLVIPDPNVTGGRGADNATWFYGDVSGTGEGLAQKRAK